MKAVILLVAALLAVANAGILAPASTLVRTPSFDSAIIKSDRLGGNFAYSSVEGHAYAAVSPVVQNVVSPVGVSYTAHTVPVGHAVVPVGAPAFAAPAVSYPGVIASPGVVSAVAPPTFVGSPAIVGAPAVVGAPAAPVHVQAPVAALPAGVESDDTVAIESA